MSKHLLPTLNVSMQRTFASSTLLAFLPFLKKQCLRFNLTKSIIKFIYLPAKPNLPNLVLTNNKIDLAILPVQLSLNYFLVR